MAVCEGLVAVALLLFGALAERGEAQEYHSVIRVRNGGPWGAWGNQDMCPEGTYATGFSIKVEYYYAGYNDNTGMNGIRLHCTERGRRDNRQDYTVESRTGIWGKWTKPIWCPPGEYLRRFSLRVDKIRYGVKDNLGVTNIRFSCSGGQDLEGHGVNLGEYGGWSHPCLNGMCGVQTKQEELRGNQVDDTALNDVVIFCCSQ